jgi:hypothetical protein
MNYTNLLLILGSSNCPVRAIPCYFSREVHISTTATMNQSDAFNLPD